MKTKLTHRAIALSAIAVTSLFLSSLAHAGIRAQVGPTVVLDERGAAADGPGSASKNPFVLASQRKPTASADEVASASKNPFVLASQRKPTASAAESASASKNPFTLASSQKNPKTK